MSSLLDIGDMDVEGDKMHEVLPLGPAGVLHGSLENGMQYYVRTCQKPKARAALQLVLKVGSIVEEEHERGIAHIVEHLAFNASEAYSNHEVVTVLESLGSAFGPCQNAYTGVEETVYELVVPTDQPQILHQALDVFREFAFKIRCAPSDLNKERGPVLEEWRSGRDAMGRASEAHWQLMLAGSRYADRLPIGLDSVIREADASTVRAFYERWYQPQHMAVIAVGDFPEPEAVVAAITAALGAQTVPDTRLPSVLPSVPWTPHPDLRCRIFADKENQSTTVAVSFKSDARSMTTPADYLAYMTAELFHSVMNSRLFKACRQPGAAFYAAKFGSEPLLHLCTAHTVAITPLEERVVDAVEAVLTELARVRMYGVTARELDIAKAEYLADVEAMYLERDQGYANDLAGEYVRHFLTGELVVGAELEARLSVTLAKLITPEGIQRVSEVHRSNASCVIKVVQFPARTTEAEIRAAVSRVDAAERSGSIQRWSQEDAPEDLLAATPEPGHIVDRRHFPVLDATELTLSNGMRICYKTSKALEDQVLLHGFAAGGLSEVPEVDFRTASLSPMLAGELGIFGFKPHVLADIVAGKRAEVKPSEGAFWRSLSGEQSPHDLDTAMKLIYCLFTNKIEAVEHELVSVLAMARQMVEATVRNPLQKFTNHVRFVNYGRCYFFRPFSVADLDRLDVHKACSHFTQAFHNPAEFTLCFTGNLDVARFEELACQYLASIPRQDSPPVRDIGSLKQLPIDFVKSPVRAAVKVDMVEPVAHVQITFPVEIEAANSIEEYLWTVLCCKLLEQRLLRKLRFQTGEVYTCSVSPFFGCEAPSWPGPLRGDIAISFSCCPDSGARLSETALTEVETLQREGPDADEVATVLTLEQRSWETAVQENDHWLEVIVKAYQSRKHREGRDLDEIYSLREEARQRMRAAACPDTVRTAMRRILPLPCRDRCTVITTERHVSLLQRVLHLSHTIIRNPAVCTVAAGVILAGAWVLFRTLGRVR